VQHALTLAQPGTQGKPRGVSVINHTMNYSTVGAVSAVVIERIITSQTMGLCSEVSRMKYNILTKRFVAIAAGALMIAASTLRASVIFSCTGTNSSSGQMVSATAIFNVVSNGADLQITLTNGGAPVLQPSDILACLFFDVNGVGTLTPVSAVLGAGSALVNGPIPHGQSLGDGWEYKGGLSGIANGATRGISATGLNPVFDAGNFGSNPQNLGGYDFGLINGSVAGGNGHIPDTAFENNSVVFTLSGLPVGFSLGASSISHVGFQYGTTTSEPLMTATAVPEPSGLALLVFGLGACIVLRRHGS